MPYPTPLKGGFILEDLSQNDVEKSFIFIPFVFNPEEVDESESANYAIHEIPGRADPYVQYVSGSGVTLSFTLVVDLERIQELRRYLSKSVRYGGENVPQAILDVLEGQTLNRFSVFTLTYDQIKGLTTYIPDTADLYIEQIKKLMLPREGRDYMRKAPPSITFLFGTSTFKGKIQDMSVTKYLFDEKLNTKYAEISMTMIRDNPLFSRRFSRLPLSINTVRLPFDEGSLRGLSTADQRRDYVTR